MSTPIMENGAGSRSSRGDRDLPGHVLAAIVTLQLSASAFTDRIDALRQLQAFVNNTDADKITSSIRRQINQLIMDNALKILMGEDNLVDLRKRQLVRAELFLMLSTLLNSNALFGDVHSELAELQDIHSSKSVMHAATVGNSGNSGGGHHNARLLGSPTGKDNQRQLEPFNDDQSLSSSLASSASTSSVLLRSKTPTTTQQDRKGPPAQPPPTRGLISTAGGGGGGGGTGNKISFDFEISRTVSTVALKTAFSQSQPQFSSTSSSSTSVGGPASILETVLAKARPRTLLKQKKLKSRPSVIANDSMDPDNFVPGADPTNWIEQDRKLGYQKPRMWLPMAGVPVDVSMVPAQRTNGDKDASSNRVVEEYLQMRALMSYVGDLVVPQRRNARANGLINVTTNPTEKMPTLKNRLSGLVDSRQYDEAVRQAMHVWSPLMGSHLPQWVQNKLPERMKQSIAQALSSSSSINKPARNNNKQFDDYDVDDDDNQSATSATSSTTITTKKSLSRSLRTLEHSVLLTKHVLRRMLKKELVATKSTANTLKEALGVAIERDIVERETVESFQRRIMQSLEAEKQSLHDSMDTMTSLLHEKIKIQHMNLPNRYLLVVEGKKANQRQLIANLMFIYLRVKRKNLLSLAMGTWKIVLHEATFAARRPLYARTAACHLMNNWTKAILLKRMFVWTRRWRNHVTLIIFAERNHIVVLLQSLYRRWRDARKFLAMHHAGHYGGPLSDIYLAPYRESPTVQYRIKRSIREDRQIYWTAARLIQAHFRRLKEEREYNRVRNKVVLIQSIVRMVPKFYYYLRLKKATIFCQSLMRRTLMFKLYRRLKYWTTVVQKYVRRYLCILLKLAMFDRKFRSVERVMEATLRLQTRYRRHAAGARVKRIVHYRQRRQWASLIMQRQWYKVRRKAFHTFVLMSSYRAMEIMDKEFDALVGRKRRYYAARIIQRYYGPRYRHLIFAATVKVQCWYRGRKGYNVVDLMRREKWASRKLRHWCHGMMRRKHAFVRRIQNMWWNAKKGRRRRHLHDRMRLIDLKEDHLVGERRYLAAARLQGYVRAIWCRRWVRRHKAALVIQRPLRFFLARKRWKREKRERSLAGVRAFVKIAIHKAVQRQTIRLLKLHNKLVTKVQARLRSLLVRAAIRRTREYAFRLGLAVVTIQRFWRRCGAVAAAVDEMMAMRRMTTNPFKACQCVHDVLQGVMQLSLRYYHLRDPRPGMKVSGLLFRLGCPELLPLFPRKDFVYVADLKILTLDKLVTMYIKWKEKSESGGGKDKDKANKSQQNNNNNKPNKKKLAIPMDVLEKIIEVVRVPFVPRKLSDQKVLEESLCPVQEIMSPAQFNDFVLKTFAKKFGRNLQARAQFLGKALTESLWRTYNNHKSLTDAMTKIQLVKAVLTTTDSAVVKTTLENLRMRSHASSVAEELTWDNQRMRECADMLQLAVDQIRTYLQPPTENNKSTHRIKHNNNLDNSNHGDSGGGALLAWVQHAVHALINYKRKFQFELERRRKSTANALAALEKAAAAVAPVATKSSAKPAQASKGKQAKTSSDSDVDMFAIDLPSTVDLNHPLTVWTALELPYHHHHNGGGLLPDNKDSEEEAIARLEVNVTVCRVYLEVLDRMFIIDRGIQALKNRWKFNGLKRAVAKQRTSKFLALQATAYVTERQTNYVRNIWLQSQRAANNRRRYEEIMKRVYLRRDAIYQQLYQVTRYGWEELYYYYDGAETKNEEERPEGEGGAQQLLEQEQVKVENSLDADAANNNYVVYYVDSLGRGFDAVYERPMYTFEEYLALECIKLKSRAYFDYLREKRRLRMEQKRQEMLAATAKWKADNDDQKRSVRVYFTVQMNEIGRYLPSASVKLAIMDDNRQEGFVPAPVVTSGGGSSSSSVVSAASTAAQSGHNSRVLQLPPPASSLPSDSVSTEHSDEGMMPWRLRFEEHPVFHAGVWTLLEITDEETRPVTASDESSALVVKSRDSSRGGNEKERGNAAGNLGTGNRRGGNNRGSKQSTAAMAAPPPLALISTLSPVPPMMAVNAKSLRYEVVVITRYDKTQRRYDVRSRKGRKYKDVPAHRLKQMNLEKGMSVEARYQGRTLFYRGTVAFVSEAPSANAAFAAVGGMQAIYSVIYDDGEREDNLTRDMIRPTPEAVDSFVDRRMQLFMDVQLRKRRLLHWDAVRRERLEGLAVRKLQAGDSGGDNDTIITTATANSHVTAISVMSGTSILSANSRSWPLVNIKIKYARAALRFGWAVTPESAALLSQYRSKAGNPQQHTSPPTLKYVNMFDKSISTTRPSYNAEEDYRAKKIQSVWYMRKARSRFQKLLSKETLEVIVRNVLLRCRTKLAYVGYHLEGVTPLQLLNRAGLWELADVITNHYQQKLPNKQVRNMKVSDLLDCQQGDFERSLGITEKQQVRKLKDFQAWWHRTDAAGREATLKLINYYKNVEDPRSIVECVRGSEPHVTGRFLKAFPSGASRTKVSVKRITDESVFPHTNLQIDTYIKKYSDKIEMAREFVDELINKRTVPTWEDERETFFILMKATRKIGVILGNLRLRDLRLRIADIEDRAQSMMANYEAKYGSGKAARSHPPSSGYEAKVALLLRVEVFDFLAQFLHAVRLVQKRIRGFVKRSAWVVTREHRRTKVSMMQRLVRIFLSRCRYYHLYEQQISAWEQLWDPKRKIMYYYNNQTYESKYEKPKGPFRPLIRDRLSSRLMQAWPHLDGDNPPRSFEEQEEESQSVTTAAAPPAVCQVCQVRKCIRWCYDCEYLNTGVHGYCFPCFTRDHGDDAEMMSHRFKDLTEQPQQQQSTTAAIMGEGSVATNQKPSLSCSMCDEPATRKCLGILDDNQIDDLCSELQRSRPALWGAILGRWNVGGERKLAMLLEQIQATNADDKGLSAVQLQHVRMMLERTRAECDECYCASCYREVHSGGKRSLHRWIGFRANAIVCAVCLRSPAEFQCQDCGATAAASDGNMTASSATYCAACNKVFHSMGKKRKHRRAKLVEDLAGPNDALCVTCDRRVAQLECGNCGYKGCDSCYECLHRPDCDKAHQAEAEAQAQARADEERVEKGLENVPLCVVCHEIADQLCQQCGDYYCSRTWMGNPGCFIQFHSKGKRAKHVTVSLSSLKQTM